ncbi:MAG TPA: hypothetical protein VHG28_23160 [Longimicrobiaceae bacterium]|nr:hypothetical protein [Longimicrobiaceae bacterium]
MAGEQHPELTDLALRLKEAVESADADALRGVLTPDARINVNGRFTMVDDFVSRLVAFLSGVEQPQLDILRVEESQVEEDHGFIAVRAELVWIDREAWEDHSLEGKLSLELVRAEQGWQVSGLTFGAEKPQQEEPWVAADSPLYAAYAESFAAYAEPPALEPEAPRRRRFWFWG